MGLLGATGAAAPVRAGDRPRAAPNRGCGIGRRRRRRHTGGAAAPTDEAAAATCGDPLAATLAAGLADADGPLAGPDTGRAVPAHADAPAAARAAGAAGADGACARPDADAGGAVATPDDGGGAAAARAAAPGADGALARPDADAGRAEVAVSPSPAADPSKATSLRRCAPSPRALPPVDLDRRFTILPVGGDPSLDAAQRQTPKRATNESHTRQSEHGARHRPPHAPRTVTQPDPPRPARPAGPPALTTRTTHSRSPSYPCAHGKRRQTRTIARTTTGHKRETTSDNEDGVDGATPAASYPVGRHPVKGRVRAP